MSRSDLAKLFGVDVRTVTNLVSEGMPKEARGAFLLSACVPWYLDREREAARGSKGLNDLDLARQRKTSAEARLAELELAQAEGQLLPMDVHEARFARVCEQLRAKLMALPSRHMGRIQQARTDAESIACGETIRDDLFRALMETADDLEAEAASGEEPA